MSTQRLFADRAHLSRSTSASECMTGMDLGADYNSWRSSISQGLVTLQSSMHSHHRSHRAQALAPCGAVNVVQIVPIPFFFIPSSRPHRHNPLPPPNHLRPPLPLPMLPPTHPPHSLRRPHNMRYPPRNKTHTHRPIRITIHALLPIMNSISLNPDLSLRNDRVRKWIGSLLAIGEGPGGEDSVAFKSNDALDC